MKSVTVNVGKSVSVPFASTEKGEWIRVKTDKNTLATVSFNYTTADPRSTSSDPIYQGLTRVKQNTTIGVVWAW